MTAFLKAAAISILAFFAPVRGLLAGALGLILIDTILGVMAAHKRKDPITSAGLRRAVVKTLVFEIAILAGHIMQSVFMPEIPAVKLIASMIGLTEGLSILENLTTLGLDVKNLISILKSHNDDKK